MAKKTSALAHPLKFLCQVLNWQTPHLTTSLHLRNEFALWIATILLTAASSHVLYKGAFLSTAGDIKFMLFVSMWLGRHFILRLICTVTWVDNHYIDGKHKHNNKFGGGWKRRRAFQTWIHARERSSSMYHRIRWLFRVCSPYNVLLMVVQLIQSYAMAGQYCDVSAANGVASAAMLSGGVGGVDDHYHHHSSKASSQHVLFGPFPQSNEVHVTVILALARMWGTLCGLSYAIWALLRGEGGAVSEMIGMVGTMTWRWIRSMTALVGLSSAKSESDRAVSELTMGSTNGGGGGGGNSKRNRRKQAQQNHSANDLHHSHRNSNNSGDSDKKSSLDLTGKLTFKLFPSNVRSQALHIQQMRTSDMYRTLEKVWDVCPPAQLLIAIAAAIILVAGWLFSLGGYNWLVGSTTGTTGLEYESVESNVPVFGGSYYQGNPKNDQFDYWRNQSPFPAPATFDSERPSWISLILLVISLGTVQSLFFYGRLLFPIPEFVAGTNVLKAIRAESRILASGGTSGGAGKGSRQKGDRDLPWSEQYKSITAENRLRLYYKVAMMRIIENMWLCVILPQTEFICRFTEHCEPGPLLWGPSGITGIAGRRFGKGGSMLTSSYDALLKDDSASAIIWISTVVITTLLLTAQMTITNRTYLAIMGYISGEWALVDDFDYTPDDNNSSPRSFLQFFMEGLGFAPSKSFRRSNSTLMQWDPKRRYQKGDRIAYDECVYEAISNSPEGPPFDPFLRTAHDLFSDELGQPMTSYMMSCLASSFIILSSNLLAFIAFWRNSGSNYQPIFLCLIASLVGGFTVTHSRERSLTETSKILTEIRA
eukprot:scaffold17501_cov120-Skeletonema_menzelii.AAC.1